VDQKQNHKKRRFPSLSSTTTSTPKMENIQQQGGGDDNQLDVVQQQQGGGDDNQMDTVQQQQGGGGDGSMNKRLRTVEELEVEIALLRQQLATATTTTTTSSLPPIPTTTNFITIPIEQIPIKMEQFLSQNSVTIATIDYSENAGRMVLGSLYKPGTRWPVVKTKLDMRVLSRHELFGSGGSAAAGDPLRPVARLVSEAIKTSTGADFGLVATPASGKTSSVIDVGREHFIIFLQASQQSDDDVHSASLGSHRISGDFDPKFADLVDDVTKLVGHFDPGKNAQRELAWQFTEQRCLVEFVARCLELARIRRQVGNTLQPFDFMGHQLCAEKRKFITHMVNELHNWDIISLQNLASQLVEVELGPILSPTRKLVLAVDETEYARAVRPGLFLRPGTETKTGKKGLLSPLASAAGLFSKITGTSIILSGTGASKEKIENMQTDLGKAASTRIRLFTQENFPMISIEDVNTLLSRLNIPSNELPKIVGGPRNRVIQGGYKSLKSMTDLIETYVVGARFRILMGALEKVKTHLDEEKVDPGALKLLEQVLNVSIRDFRDGLVTIFRKRIGPNSDFTVKRETLETMEMLYVGAAITNGEARFMETSLNLMGNSQLPPPDLTEIGIPSISLNQKISKENSTTKRMETVAVIIYGITEAFVFDALFEYFAAADVQQKMTDVGVINNVHLLKQVLQQFGEEAQFKGNVVERLLLLRLVELSKTCGTVGQLPFIKPELDKNPSKKAQWSQLPYKPQAIREPSSDQTTPAFLASVNAPLVAYWPEDQCRPDGIVMISSSNVPMTSASSSSLFCGLPRMTTSTSSSSTSTNSSMPRYAITLASAVYSGTVTSAKVNDQIKSADMSRAFLSKEKGTVYDATSKRRKEWFKLGLHKTRTIRVCVTLPHGPQPEVDVGEKETTEEGGKLEQTSGDDLDLLITLDRTNIHLLIGNDPRYKDIYTLLKVATRCWDGWGVA
jgi:hypothetical protein